MSGRGLLSRVAPQEKNMLIIRHRNKLTLTLAFAVLMLASPVYRARAQAAWEVLFNGEVSKTEVHTTENGSYVPVFFPVPEEGESQSYGVLIETDGANKQIKVTKVKKKSPVKVRGDCPKCLGSKDCQDCYPAGSGVGTSGGSCYSCNGSGDCPYCQGSGDCYTCGGKGFPGGCNTCGDVSS